MDPTVDPAVDPAALDSTGGNFITEVRFPLQTVTVTLACSEDSNFLPLLVLQLVGTLKILVQYICPETSKILIVEKAVMEPVKNNVPLNFEFTCTLDNIFSADL